MAASVIQYQTTAGGAWTTESQWVRFTVTDSLGYPCFAEVTVADPQNATKQLIYNNAFARIRINLENTGQYIFSGRVESAEPLLDPHYGQCIKIRARDNLVELMHRTISTGYPGYTQRSALIAQIVSDHRYQASNISTADATFFEASAVTEAANVVTKDFTNSGKSALRAIRELASSDPDAATNTTYGYDYLLTYLFSGNQPADKLNYFRRGSRPSGGASLTVQLNATETNTRRSMLPDYSFPIEQKEAVTRVRIEYISSANVSTSMAVILLSASGGAGTFTQGETVTGSISGTTATFWYAGTDFVLVSAWSGNFTSGETITGGSSGATRVLGTPPSLRQTLEQDVEIVLRGYDLTNLNDALKLASQALKMGNGQIQRGNFRVVRWPYATLTGTHTGANNAATLTDATATFVASGVMPDMTVSNTTDGSSGTITARTATTVTATLSGGSENDWDTGDAWRIYVLMRAGMLLRVNNSNVYVRNSSGTNVVLNEDMLVTQIVYDEGPGIQTARINVVKHEKGQGIKPDLIEELTRDDQDGLLAAGGRIRLGSGVIGTNFTGIALDASGLVYNSTRWHLAGLNNETLEVGIRATDGKILAGAGAVTIGADGIIINGEELMFRGSDSLNDATIFVYDNTDPSYPGFLAIDTNRSILLSGTFTGIWIAGSALGVRPVTDNVYNLGSALNRWIAIYGYTGDFTTSLTAPSGVFSTSVNTPLLVNTGGTSISVTENLLPSGTQDLGASGTRWDEVFAATGDFSTQVNTPLLVNTAGTGIRITEHFLPNATATYTLGEDTTPLRWNNIYSVSGDFSGTVTGLTGSFTTVDTTTMQNSTGTSIAWNEDLTMGDGKNIITNATTGTKIATATTQKIAFYGVTPTVQPSAYTPTNYLVDRAFSASTVGTTELADVVATLITDLQLLGLIG